MTIIDAFRSGNHVAIETIYAGHIRGAPNPFAVHVSSIMRLHGNKIASNTDYYQLQRSTQAVQVAPDLDSAHLLIRSP